MTALTDPVPMICDRVPFALKTACLRSALVLTTAVCPFWGCSSHAQSGRVRPSTVVRPSMAVRPSVAVPPNAAASPSTVASLPPVGAAQAATIAWAKALVPRSANAAVPKPVAGELTALIRSHTRSDRQISVRWALPLGSADCPSLAVCSQLVTPLADPAMVEDAPTNTLCTLLTCSDGSLRIADELVFDTTSNSAETPLDSVAIVADLDGDALSDVSTRLRINPQWHGPFFEALVFFGSAHSKLALAKIGDSWADESLSCSAFVQLACVLPRTDSSMILLVQNLERRTPKRERYLAMLGLGVDQKGQLEVVPLRASLAGSELAKADAGAAVQGVAGPVRHAYSALDIPPCEANTTFVVEWPRTTTDAPRQFAVISHVRAADSSPEPAIKDGTPIRWRNSDAAVILAPKDLSDPLPFCAAKSRPKLLLERR